MFEGDIMRTDFKNKLISQLQNKLLECMDKNKAINIHLHNGHVTTRISAIPDSFDVNEDEIYIEYKSFILDIERIDNIETVYDIPDCDSFYVVSGETEIFFDFDEAYNNIK